MKETFGQKTRRSHKRNQRVVMFWCAFVFAFVIAGVWLFRGTLFQNDSGASSSGTNQSRHDACGTADSRQKSTDVTQAPMDHGSLSETARLGEPGSAGSAGHR